LRDKVEKQLSSSRFMPPGVRRVDLRLAAALGMDEDARSALTRITTLALNRKIAVAGRFMPDRGVAARLATHGIVENVTEEDFSRFDRVVIPYSGVPPRQKREWEQAGHRLEDLSSPQLRRAQVALGLLRMEGAQALVIGRHDDPESLALAGVPGTRIIQDTTDTARLVFSPAFGVVCQTNLSPRKVSWLVQQLRHRWHDARVTFLDTASPAMAAREEALERLLVDCDEVVIVGDPDESSCQALAETASRRGKQAVVVGKPDELEAANFAPLQKIALTAGAFATDEAIREVAEALAAK
jgi:4-hydroxy-3-methylbut-2-en-1-yl diphosphate reductase